MRDSFEVSVGIRPGQSSVHNFRYINRAHGSIARTQAGQCVDTVNVHSTASTDSLSTTAAECQRGIDFVLDPNQSIQHHRSSLVQIQGVRLHAWLLGRMIRIPSVDVKGLDPGLLRRGRLLNRRRLGLRNKLAAGGGRLADLGERINGSVGSREDRRCREEWPGAG
jgi:hypothetical protein